MKVKCNRGILFAKVNDNKNNLLSLLSVAEGILALTDEQVKIIDEQLVVRSLEEFEHKFEIKFEGMEATVKEEDTPIGEVADFYRAFGNREQERSYKIWYYDACEKKTNNGDLYTIPVKLYEVWLGVKTFFEQGRGEKLELLITNTSYEELETRQAADKLALYINTVNGKLENEQRLAIAIFPEIPITSEKKDIRRIRFEGKQETKEQDLGYGILATILDILAGGQIMSCYQYVTGELTSAKVMAKEGRDKLINEARFFQEQVNCMEISCCYPNLTWIEDQVYIGAAYIVAGMLLAGNTEKSVSTLPRELYPYEQDVWEELYGMPFGSMLAYSPKTGERNMLLYWARSQKWSSGDYQILNDI